MKQLRDQMEERKQESQKHKRIVSQKTVGSKYSTYNDNAQLFKCIKGESP